MEGHAGFNQEQKSTEPIEPEVEEAEEDVDMDEVSDDDADPTAPMDANLFQRLARDAAQMHQETADDSEEDDDDDEEYEDGGDEAMEGAAGAAGSDDHVPIVRLLEEDEYFDAPGTLLTILNEADLNVEDHEAMADLITSDLYLSDTPSVLFGLTLDDFRRILHGYREAGSREETEWLGLVVEHKRVEAEQEALEPTDWATDDPIDREDEEERAREGWLEWAATQLEEAKRVTGSLLRWEDVRPYLRQFSKADAQDMREFISAPANQINPNASLLEWVTSDRRRDEEIPLAHQHAYNLLLQLVIQMADEQCEVFEDQLDKKDTITRAIECLAANLTKLIQHVRPPQQQASEPTSATEAPPAAAAAAASSSTAAAAAAAAAAASTIEDEVETVDVADLEAERVRIEAYLRELPRIDAELEKNLAALEETAATSTLSTSVASLSEENTPADDLALEVQTRRAFLASAHRRVLELLEGEDIPITAGDFWADCLRTTAVDLEQGFSFETVIPPRAFERLARTIAGDYTSNLDFEPAALRLLQEAAESFLVRRFDLAGAQVDAVQQLQRLPPDQVADLYQAVPLSDFPRPPVNLEHAHMDVTLEPPPAAAAAPAQGPIWLC